MLLKKNFIVMMTAYLLGCNQQKKTQLAVVSTVSIPVLNLIEANRLAQLPLHCMETEYPNKLQQIR